MKCSHCLAPVERNAWFCPNCKRSIRSLDEHRLTWGRILATAGLTFLITLAGVGVGVEYRATHPDRPVQKPAAEQPVVSVHSAADPAAPNTAGAAPPAVFGPEVTGQPVPPTQMEPAAPPLRQTHAEAAPVREPDPSPVDTSHGTGTLTVTTDPPTQTYVYLNGGTLLGETPLIDKPVRAGMNTLVFWTPSVGGRSTRTVNVPTGESVRLMESIRAQSRFAAAVR